MSSNTEASDVDDGVQLPATSQSPSKALVAISLKCEGEEGEFVNIKFDDEATVAAPPQLPPPSGDEINENDADDTALPDVSFENSNPDLEYYLNGAVSLDDNVPGRLGEFEHDEIVCDLRYTIDKMPYKVIRRKELFTLDLPFNDNATMRRFSGEFLTTYLGIRRALEEWDGLKASVEDKEEFESIDWDGELFKAMMRRGGCGPRRYQQVVYPEDIIPVEHLQLTYGGGWEWNGETEVADEEYWLELKAQGEIWDEIEVP